jgi:nitroreductase
MDELILQQVAQMYFGYMDNEMVKGFEPMVAGNPTPPADPRMIIGGFGAVARKEIKPSLGAPAAILVSADVRGIGGPTISWGIGGQNMCLAANSLGIGSCWLGFYGFLDSNSEIKKKLGLEYPFQLMGGIVLGYPKFKQEGMVPRDYRPVTWFRNGWSKPDIET